MAFGKDVTSPVVEPRHAANATLVARDTRFVGELTGGRSVRIEGVVQGKIDLKAPLEIAEGAVLEAEIHATAVRVAGAVTGNITAGELVELLASAVVKGDISSPALHVVEGAKLEGKVQMQAPPPRPAAPRPMPAPEPPKPR